MPADKLTVTDAGGRKLTLRALDPADMLDLLEAAGDASVNQGYIRYAMVVCSVEQIDNLPIPAPSSKDQIKALGRRLGNTGFSAAAKALFGDPAAPAADKVAATAKN
jgi:hypothetical protein